MSDLIAPFADHRRVYQDFLYVYPVVSRRSRGVSLGINLNPDKICNFDCVYCEVDRITPARTNTVDHAILDRELRSLLEIWKSGALFDHAPFNATPPSLRRLNDIALSGDGEPTSYGRFDEVMELIVRIKVDHALTDAKIVLITDAAGLDRRAVMAGLALMDRHQGEIWAKLDAGTADYYRRVNRSAIGFDRILKNILLTAQVRPLFIQTLFLQLNGEAPSPGEIAAYCARLTDLVREGAKLSGVQIYTVARPTPEAWATALPEPLLQQIADSVRSATGLPVESFAGNA
ncbi:MAG: radical SAM protein [Verrucomicrobiae bacterium]|nr:radical SAM protein [Verrucomicrobiae bacterium]